MQLPEQRWVMFALLKNGWQWWRLPLADVWHSVAVHDDIALVEARVVMTWAVLAQGRGLIKSVKGSNSACSCASRSKRALECGASRATPLQQLWASQPSSGRGGEVLLSMFWSECTVFVLPRAACLFLENCVDLQDAMHMICLQNPHENSQQKQQ